MKNKTQKFIGIIAIVFAISFTANSKEIGDIFQGGYIIQINDDGSGLVADLVDLGPGLMWNQAIDAAINSNLRL